MWQLTLNTYTAIASHAGVFRGARFSDEKRAPLKTPAWEANIARP